MTITDDINIINEVNNPKHNKKKAKFLKECKDIYDNTKREIYT